MLALYPAAARALPWGMSSWLGYALSWLPLVAGVVLAVLLGGGRGSIPSAIGLRVRGIDLLLGPAVGLGLRSIIEFVAPTAADLGDAALTDQAQWATYLVSAGILIVAACLIGPVVEESLFRGVIQPALWQFTRGMGTTPAARRARGAVAIAVTSLAFAAMHMLAAPWPPALGTVVATIGVGVGCGILSFATGRLGGAILAHAVFNASGLAIAYLA